MISFKDKHKGQRALIACNGPSLNDIDFSKLQHEVIFGLNRGYLKKDMPITYLVAVNDLVVQQFRNEILAQSVKQVFGYNIGINLKFDTDVPKFEPDATKPLWQGHTVTYVALQLAYYMGFTDVALIGCDHSYKFDGNNNQKLVSTGDDVNHFDPSYFGEGILWHAPNLPRTEIAYMIAKEYYEKNNRMIVNCSTKTQLNIFEKMKLEDWLDKRPYWIASY